MWGLSASLSQEESIAPAPVRTADPGEAVRKLREFATLWASRSEDQRAEMNRAVYAPVEVEGPRFVAARLTPDPQSLGLTVALPEKFVVASPAGFEPATRCLEGSRSGPLSYGDVLPKDKPATVG